MKEDVRIYENVDVGIDSELGQFVIVGYPPRGHLAGALKTIIGANSTIRSHTIIYAGNNIGKNFQTGHHVMIRESNDIGDDVSIGTGTVIEHHVKIGNNVRIHSQAFIPEFSILEDGCWIGPNVVLTNAKYPNRPDTKMNLKGVTIKKGAVVGANVTILPGVTVHVGALIGAGAVVTKDVPEGVIYK